MPHPNGSRRRTRGPFQERSVYPAQGPRRPYPPREAGRRRRSPEMTVRQSGQQVEYRSARAGAMVSVQVPIGDPVDGPDALTRFLTERYRLYAHHLGLS